MRKDKVRGGIGHVFTVSGWAPDIGTIMAPHAAGCGELSGCVSLGFSAASLSRPRRAAKSHIPLQPRRQF
jgi:hypothetical protein